MNHSIIIYTVYLVIILAVFVSLAICYKKQNAPSFTFCGGIMTLLVVVLLSTLPVRNKITSPGLSIEPRLDQIEYKQKELSAVVSALAEIQAIAYETALQEGLQPEKKLKVEEDIKILEAYLTPDTIKKLKGVFGIK